MSGSTFNFSSEVRVRLPETDAMGIIFHGWFPTYMEVARTDYLRNLDLTRGHRPLRDFDSVVVRAAFDIQSTARFDDALIVHIRLAEIGRTSFRFEYRIMHKRENRIVAEGETVHVALDMTTWKPVPVPESFREVIRRYEGANLVERKP